MQAPVTKRKTGTAAELGSQNRMATLARPATAAPAENKRRRSKRSGRLSRALNSVPATKPPCTLLVSSASWNGDSATCARMADSDAVVANQVDMAATSLTNSTASEKRRPARLAGSARVMDIPTDPFLWPLNLRPSNHLRPDVAGPAMICEVYGDLSLERR